MRIVLVTGLLLGFAASSPLRASAEEMNACGCFHDETGACKCTNKKAKCACPNDCEPVGCADKREKEAAKEADATLKRIQAREKKRAADAAKLAKTKSKAKLKPAEKIEPLP